MLREMSHAGMVRQAEVIIVLETRVGLKIASRRRRASESRRRPGGTGPSTADHRSPTSPAKAAPYLGKKMLREGYTLSSFAMLLQLSDYIALQT
ncbi:MULTISPECIES: hypothetical protein [unclassified Mesorhizobium]|uniref:hypothetical protein n=1 Tax=unclassified Mesorhizobium TaxID=325217 RepID=UPI001126B6B3|nr:MULTISPECIES: hypothetical protein [unclassified Mesorhizobium]TPI50470.1 hypothetical protein FJW11_24320 [Mesorhizobium sp. B3-1-1]TPJ78659.1 hypothetical protein FJ422_26475 [Mesorhizobium sp. B2-6-3]TPJ95491.1 hypothetical protein FJ491_23285 [Mesorhizobium sp. B2-5-10]TPK12035.1 hypothetical protein FJ490_07330 [Mesorhizobium sp. B2-5-11]TPK30881.1 hypothetical protein FJ885_20265 [Mesorhizobium sp. B2-5-8]